MYVVRNVAQTAIDALVEGIRYVCSNCREQKCEINTTDPESCACSCEKVIGLLGSTKAIKADL